jgi:hypothetical protein
VYKTHLERAMNSNEATSPLSIFPPLTERVVGEVFNALRSAQLVVTAFWKRHRVAPVDDRAFESIANLDEHTLKDIGAPHWLVARAADERDARHLRWIEFEVR